MTQGMFRKAFGLAALVAFIGCGGAEESGSPGASVDEVQGSAQARVDNQMPEILNVEIEPLHPRSGSTVLAVISAEDPDGDNLTYGFLWEAGGERVGRGKQSFTLDDVRRGDILSLRVSVSDGVEEVHETVSVTVGNSAPVLSGVRLQAVSPDGVEQFLVASPTATDPDGDDVEFEYEWLVNGSVASGEGDRFSFKEYRVGDDIQVFVVASDGEDRSAELKSEVYAVGNNPPIIVSKPTPDIAADGTIRYQILAQDSDSGSRLRYSLANAPEGMEIDNITGELAWTPAEAQRGEFPVQIVVDDLEGGTASQRFTITVADTEEPAPDPLRKPRSSR